jgi:lipoprotein-anchoring transpeptidase ErfK/SrfK
MTPMMIAVILGTVAGLALQPPLPLDSESPPDATLTVQVALDRAGFSPGEIDGRMGRNTQRAIEAFREARGLRTAEGIDDELRAALSEHAVAPLVEYRVTAEDLAGPFESVIPSDLMAKATLDSLGYTSAWEMLAERFHASPAFLRGLNPGDLTPGTAIRVPNVEPLAMPGRSGPRKAKAGGAAQIVVNAQRGALTVTDSAGRVILHAPVTVGGANDPLPTGAWKAVEVFDLPIFNYNPDLFWDADPGHAKALINPGPNNPVGVVWIDLDLKNYGIHGTPEPSRIGRSESHGCVRLTNWDVLRLAALVGRGTPVVFQ